MILVSGGADGEAGSTQFARNGIRKRGESWFHWCPTVSPGPGRFERESRIFAAAHDKYLVGTLFVALAPVNSTEE